MSKVSKIVSLLLVVVMVMGVTLTVFAAESAKAKTDEEKAQEIAGQVDQSVEAVGNASVSAITDTATLAKAYDMGVEADAAIASVADQFTEQPTVYKTILCDVNSAGGDVTLKSSDCAGKLGIATHLNTTTGQIEAMKDLVEFDSQGRGTVHFDSYSPVMIKVLNQTRSALKPDATVGVKAVNLAAPQVDASSTATAKTAKMGE